jgi:hypothetical protein
MKLTRKDFVKSGVFGSLTSDDGAFFCRTLEHAFEGLNTIPFDSSGSMPAYQPKVPPGLYKCVRGVHQLSHGGPFETFEVTGVVGHSGILFHPGNVNADSEGCILLGLGQEGDQMITDSRLAFEAFMAFVAGLDEFSLVVE